MVVRGLGGSETEVLFTNVQEIFSLVDQEGVAPLAAEVDRRLRAAADALVAGL